MVREILLKAEFPRSVYLLMVSMVSTVYQRSHLDVYICMLE